MKEEKSEKKGIRDYPENEQNPFVTSLILKTKKRNIAISNSNMVLTNAETGELDNSRLFVGMTKNVDKEHFIKIYQSQLKVLFTLTSAGVKVFGYFMNEMAFNDRVLFDVKRAKDFTGYKSSERIFSGLAELLENEFVARTTIHNVYYVNPSIFFKGDRLVLFTEYIKRDDVSIEINDK